MKAVFSFWSKPFRLTRSRLWLSEAHHLYSWALAVHRASQYYPTCLITDDDGKRLLVDELGLSFDECSTDLNALDEYDPGWWALSKLYAHSLQKDPFVQVDSDLYLWKRLPDRIERAPVLAQNPEVSDFGVGYPAPTIRHVLESSGRSWFPEEWRWYESAKGRTATSSGIIGGQRPDFFSYFGRSALAWLKHPDNQEGLAALKPKWRYMSTLSEWFLRGCVDFHQGRQGSPFADIDVEYLFPTAADAWNGRTSAEMGFTHLIGEAKTKSENCDAPRGAGAQGFVGALQVMQKGRGNACDSHAGADWCARCCTLGVNRAHEKPKAGERARENVRG